MVRSERIENFVIGGLTSVFILLTIGLAINWLTGHEAQRSLILMILGGPSPLRLPYMDSAYPKAPAVMAAVWP